MGRIGNFDYISDGLSLCNVKFLLPAPTTCSLILKILDVNACLSHKGFVKQCYMNFVSINHDINFMQINLYRF